MGAAISLVPFFSSDDKQKSFGEIHEPINVITFVGMPYVVCCKLLPDLVKLVDRFKNNATTVA